MKEELLKGLSEEQIKKLDKCESSEEMLALAKSEGIELTDEQLQAVSGGVTCGENHPCPKCGSKNIRPSIVYRCLVCKDCGYEYHGDGSPFTLPN